jgi:hypothetical protein
VDTVEAAVILGELRVEASALGPNTLSSSFVSWRHRVETVLARALGDDHRLTVSFLGLWWTPSSYTTAGEDGARAKYFSDAMMKGLGILDAAQYELRLMGRTITQAVDHGFDPELWNFVQSDVAAEAWGKVVSQAGIFTEHRIRTWTGRPAEEVGQALMTSVLGDTGQYRLGITEGESRAWHLLAMGISGALRNPGGHRIIERPDHKTHAIGVLGACSVLLTELRFSRIVGGHRGAPSV